MSNRIGRIIGPYLQGVFIGVTAFGVATAALAEPVPGDACTAAGVTTLSAGPEDTGVGYRLVCDGTVWKSVIEFVETDGRVRLNFGNDQTACGAAKTGRLRYDDGDDVWEYCDGADWQPLLPVLPALPDPVAWYKLDDGAGLTAVDSIAGNDGALTNMVGTEWTTGKDGGALAFDGDNDFVNIPTHVFPTGGNTRTIALWLSPSNITTRMDVIDYGVEITGQNWRIIVNLDGNGVVSIANYQGRHVTPGVLSPSTWTHIAVVFPQGGVNNSDHLVYINGVVQATSLASGSNGPVNTVSDPAWISDAGDAINGAVDDLRVYDVALTADEVLALYNSYP
jgi:hypothetical protein